MPKPIPKHLRRYTIKQDYSRYTPEDQAVWRFAMRSLKKHLSDHAHSCYLSGLKKTGIDSESIPRVSTINKKLLRFGWGAVPVSGFIPPAAFMEFQALGYLPIATEIRTAEHIEYTPAPDIIHEAAGHAPIIVDKEYAAYLRQYATIAAKSIISSQDMGLYQAIRELSDAKEDPKTTSEQVSKLEKSLEDKVKASTEISEAGILSRMNWWTAEYGLIGSLESPKIFGAGLLSSPGEAVSCLSNKVKKIPFSIDCINFSYDITERQPQLFVTPDFRTLSKVLSELQKQMSFEQGGSFGLKRAKAAATVNTIQIDTGLQISGKVDYFTETEGAIAFVKFLGPSQISFNGKQLKGHGTKYHSQGYSTPLGSISNFNEDLSSASPRKLKDLGFRKNRDIALKFSSGITLNGRLISITTVSRKNILMSFKNCSVKNGDTVLFAPEWGNFDLALGKTVTSVFGGPADRRHYGDTDDFVAKVVPKRKRNTQELRLYKIYSQIRRQRSLKKKASKSHKLILGLWADFQKEFIDQWLVGLEIYELMLENNFAESELKEVLAHLHSLPLDTRARESLQKGLKLLEATRPSSY